MAIYLLRINSKQIKIVGREHGANFTHKVSLDTNEAHRARAKKIKAAILKDDHFSWPVQRIVPSTSVSSGKERPSM